MKLNRSLIGKQYPPQDYGVTAEATMRYAQAYNDANPWFLDTDRPGGIVAPPMFGVVAGWMSIMLVMTDAELGADLLRLLHSEQDMVFYKPLVPGDIVTSTATILSMETQATGEIVVVEVSSVTQDQELVQRMLFTAFIRGGGRRERKSEEASRGERPEGAPLFRIAQTIDPDQTYRYAQASGDYNPIHTDEAVAKMAGLPGIIVHGLCTMAFASKAMIDQCCTGDPRRLKRLRACFLRPVLPGQTITTAAWAQPDHDGVHVYAYEMENSEGKVVITDGLAEVAAT